MRYLGSHVSSAGGLENALKNAQELEINTIQIHPSPPQRWNAQPFEEGKESKFLEAFPASKVKKVFFHGIYLINLANPDKQKFHLSKMSLVNYLDLSSRMNADGVIFHTGSFKDIEEKEGYERVVYGIDWILEHAENDAKLLLEVAAGAGKVVGAQVEDLARIYEKVVDKKRVAFALDTQHMWASGYDWKNNLDGIIANVDKTLGLENIKAIHLNDSKTELASKRDRHENLGDGLIGLEAIKAIINHSKLVDIPFILETPNLKAMDTAKEEVQKLKSLVK